MNIFFWTGMLSANYTSISPIPALFLTLDRCFALRFPLRFNKASVRHLLSLCCITIILIDYIGSTVILLLELPLPMIKNCITFGCVPIKHKTYYQLFWKTAFGSMDLSCGIYFFYLLRTKASLNILNNNRIVKATLVTGLLFNIIPSADQIIGQFVLGQSTTNFLGQFMTMFVMVDSACCSVIYTVLFVKKPACLTKASPVVTFIRSSTNTGQ
ncbi:hypothetical protein DdX_17039 [Ditylenchus destructor]|uniref:Uncharacterized protein n=1 Tax=Ditylenchus destructor TaxID=166010 RepID=A0AAD4MMV9_9BILA|nr:hypothetical protein DdX_17039 [Ditylenchus destructor]